MTEKELRIKIINCYKTLEVRGLGLGTSGNVSVRNGDIMLITPSAVPLQVIKEEMISIVPINGPADFKGPMRPSTEWRFHRALYQRGDVGAVVHFHSPYATALAMTRQPIPASHYSVAAFGGASVEVADYACYGTAALAQNVVKAMEKRVGCLIANHGALVVAETIEAALARAEMLEALAKYQAISLQIGGPVLLSDAEIKETIQANASYKFGVD